MEKLALHGGKPVRTKPMPTDRLGGSLYGEEEMRELADVVSAKSPFRHYGMGEPEKTKKFEALTRELLKSKYTLALSSGTAALACAIAALKVGPGDEIILPAFGWHSDYAAILMSGALPVFAGIDDSLCLDPQDFERKITERTKAVIVIHYQGGNARMNEIMEIVRRYNVKVIEDCAQAFGGEYESRPYGTMGDIGIASFQFNKMITSGEGGLLYTNSEPLFARAVRYHDLGMIRPYFLDQLEDKSLGDPALAFPGNQYRISELQSAVLVAQLAKLPSILEKCRNYHAKLEAALSDLPFQLRPVQKGHCGITLFAKLATGAEAKRFTQALKAEGIPCGPSSSCSNLMELPMVKNRSMAFDGMPPFAVGFHGEHVQYSENPTSLQTSEILSRYVAIPIGPQYAEEDVDDIIAAIRKVFRCGIPADPVT